MAPAVELRVTVQPAVELRVTVQPEGGQKLRSVYHGWLPPAAELALRVQTAPGCPPLTPHAGPSWLWSRGDGPKGPPPGAGPSPPPTWGVYPVRRRTRALPPCMAPPCGEASCGQHSRRQAAAERTPCSAHHTLHGMPHPGFPPESAKRCAHLRVSRRAQTLYVDASALHPPSSPAPPPPPACPPPPLQLPPPPPPAAAAAAGGAAAPAAPPAVHWGRSRVGGKGLNTCVVLYVPLQPVWLQRLQLLQLLIGR